MRRVEYLLIVGMIFFLTGCSNPSIKNNSQDISELTLPDMHNARIALDYAGLYKGIIPCADCEGIETTLRLTFEGKFLYQIVYKGKSEKVYEKSGTYTWNDAGNTIILDGVENTPNQYFVGENMIIQLDMEGNRIASALADKYILEKTE